VTRPEAHGREGSAVRLMLTWALLGALAAPLLAILAPAALGYRSFTVMSGSMAPAIAAGDVVITRPIAPTQAEPGDIVTFRDPGRDGRWLTHRVQRSMASADVVTFDTRGDANDLAERWSVPADGRIGRVAYVVRWAGFVAQPAGTPLGRLLLIAVPSFLVGVALLVWAWRPDRPSQEPDTPDAPDGRRPEVARIEVAADAGR
jgi:signal peptidase I